MGSIILRDVGVTSGFNPGTGKPLFQDLDRFCGALPRANPAPFPRPQGAGEGIDSSPMMCAYIP